MTQANQPPANPGRFKGRGVPVSDLVWSLSEWHRLPGGTYNKELGVLIFEHHAPPRLLEGHHGGVRNLAWSPDGRRLASASRDDTIRLWDPERPEALAVLNNKLGMNNALAWRPDGRRLASADGDHGTVQIWPVSTDLRDLRAIAKAALPVGHKDFLPEERRRFFLNDGG